MRPRTVKPSRRLLLLTVGVVAALALTAGVVRWDRQRHVHRVGDATDGWATIEHDGVRVEVPGDWRRVDQDGCEFAFERWAPPGVEPCSVEGGVAFYAEATYDAATGPGLQRDDDGWAGYGYEGEYAVHVSDADRAVVRRVLASVG